MKVLVAGDWHSELHEEAVYQALIQLRHAASKFSWHQYFKYIGFLSGLASIFLRIQNKYMFGPAVLKLNRDFLETVEREKPDIVFVYRGTHIYPRTLKRLHILLPNVVIVGYNNDDPFSPHYPKWMWRHFRSGIPEYDVMLAYRPQNVAELLAHGGKNVRLMRSWFISERNYPTKLSETETKRFKCDVVFIGHYENDGRLRYLEEVVRQGWNLKIFGPGYEWNKPLSQSPLLKGYVPVNLVWSDDYNKAICGAKIALCFFSKLNRDSYTRRCFEIPASGTVLLSEHSDDMSNMFLDGSEVALFRNLSEFKSEISKLLKDDESRTNMAIAGRARVLSDGHDVVSRTKEMLNYIEGINESE